MIAAKLKSYLEDNQVDYRTIHHTAAYTAQQTAEMAHIPGHEVLKPVIVKLDGKLVMIIEPASLKVNLRELGQLLKVKKVELATEADFRALFPDSEVGAMPPLGVLYGMESYIDAYMNEILAQDENVVFNAGTHTELVEMKFKDFEILAKPKPIHLMH